MEEIGDALNRWRNYFHADDLCHYVYVSTPINTGLRFVDWWREFGRNLDTEDPLAQKAFRESVRLPNEKAAQRVAESLRKSSTENVVLNPADFPDPEGWDQPMFHEFWTEVIRQYVDEMVLVDGWPYSHGCCREYLAAVAHGVPCFDERGAKIDLAKGQRLVEEARATLADAGMNTDVHDDVLQHLAVDVSKVKKD